METYFSSEIDVNIFVAGSGVKLHNLVAGETLTGQSGFAGGRGRRGGGQGGDGLP